MSKALNTTPRVVEQAVVYPKIYIYEAWVFSIKRVEVVAEDGKVLGYKDFTGLNAVRNDLVEEFFELNKEDTSIDSLHKTLYRPHYPQGYVLEYVEEGDVGSHEELQKLIADSEGGNSG